MTTISAQRAKFAEIRDAQAWENGSEIKKAFVELVRKQATWPLETAAQWLAAAEATRVRCGRCAGTGSFVTYVENGQPKGPGGMCFRCRGTGSQTYADVKRNETHDRHYMGGAL